MQSCVTHSIYSHAQTISVQVEGLRSVGQTGIFKENTFSCEELQKKKKKEYAHSSKYRSLFLLH
jgi:hypothetical protein